MSINCFNLIFSLSRFLLVVATLLGKNRAITPRRLSEMLELLNTLLGGKAVASDTPIPYAVAPFLNVEQQNGKPRKKSSCQFEYLRLRKCGV